MLFNHPKDVELEREGGFAMPGRETVGTVLPSFIAVDCI
jgi:hypothetical protein